MMLKDSFSSKKSSTNKKKRKFTKQKGGVAKKKVKEMFSKGTCFIVAKKAIGREIERSTWSQRRRWHVMHHHLQVFMSLRLILFLMTTFG